MSGRRSVAGVITGLVAALALLTASPPAAASPPAQAGREVTVASYNLFLGGDIGSLTTTGSPAAFFAAAAALWQNVVATDFPARAEAIADLLAEDQPHVVGLQEVANWQTTNLLTGGPGPSYDFQALLLDALADRGTPYRVIASNTNFVSPVVPVQQVGLAIQFTDRDVVIARADAAGGAVKASNRQAHEFVDDIDVPLPVGVTIEIVRGWSTVDVTFLGTTFRFANTHLEAFSPDVRNRQAAELAASLATSPYPVVLAGDLNSQPTDSTGAYGLMQGIGLADAWVDAPGTGDGDTAGQTDSLTNVPSTIDHRIDYVLYDPDADGGPALDAVEAHVIGEELDDRTATEPPMWPSDHAGVVATLRIARP